MISTLIGLLGIAGSAAGALGSLGGLVKLLGAFAPAAAATVLSNPLTGAVAKFAEGFFDVLWRALWAVLAYIGTKAAEAIDHITGHGVATILVLALCWGSYTIGGIGYPEPKSPPVTRSAPPAPAPKASVPRPVQKQQTPSVSLNPLDWLGNIFH